LPALPGDVVPDAGPCPAIEIDPPVEADHVAAGGALGNSSSPAVSVPKWMTGAFPGVNAPR
jgi:hypothetical protein